MQGVGVDVVCADDAASQLLQWARQRQSRTVCLCNVHAVVTARHDAEFRRALEAADLVAPDGAPVAFMQRRLGARGQRRVAGPDLMAQVLALAAAQQVPVFLYGGSPETLERLQARLRARWPALQLAGALSPPFREPTREETADHVQIINDSGAGIVWVGLGCPKQERWMHQRRGQVQAVMVGVGAAFDFLAGTIARAPSWMQAAGLEWLHRLWQQPRRLGPRYLVTNTHFVLGAAWQMLRRRR